jgi:SPASM domain peptide maturase of grasp-with-spasm system
MEIIDKSNVKVSLRLYAHNVPVRGKERSAIYDLRSGIIKIIPNQMFEVIATLQTSPLDDVRQEYAEDEAIFDEYCNFLLSNNLAFLTTEPHCFPPLAIAYNCPKHIANAVVEYSFEHYSLEALLEELNDLNCKDLELRVWNCEDARKLAALSNATKSKSFRSINLFLEYTEWLSLPFLESLYAANAKLSRVIVYNSPVEANSYKYPHKVLLRKENYKDTKFKEGIPKDTYCINMEYFMEANFYNPYYNKKVAVDYRGDVKNCLLHSNAFGNLNEKKLAEIVNDSGFQVMWRANHDKINGVRDSELRYCMVVSDKLAEDAPECFSIIECK